MDKKIVKQVYVSNFGLDEDNTKKLFATVKPASSGKPLSSNIKLKDEAKTDDKNVYLDNQNQNEKQSNQVILTEKSFLTESKKKEEKKEFKFIEKLKSIKNFEVYVALIFVIIILFIYFGSSFSCSSSNKNKKDDTTYQSAYDYCQEVESRLRKILSSVKNAGKVDVMITFESTPERVIAYITSSSSNISSGQNGQYNENTTNTSTPQIVYVKGDQIPLILKEISPKVTGVLVVAEGADDVKVKLDIISAVSVVLDVSPDKIKVLTMNKG
ncbi:MAG TPA: hypothetical protein VIL23_02285 [Clostridia bacterium]